MTTYQIKYQTRIKANVSIRQGEWQDEEEFIIAGDDAREAIYEVERTTYDHDFRLIEVRPFGHIERIVHNFGKLK